MSEELTWLPAWRIRELIGKRELSPVEVTEHFLGRIEALDPKLKAFRTLDATGAREQARRAEATVLSGEPLGPLHGIPISVKEHIPVAGLPLTRFMLPAFSSDDGVASRDHLGVERLRDAGAVIVGANTMMGSGSAVFGQYDWDVEARNPWDTGRVPGWSSSGGAAAAAARLLPITIGSDGGGSMRLPAAYSGVVGVHPSAGLVPAPSYEIPHVGNPTVTIGPLCRNVVDAAITLKAMAGPDGRDWMSTQMDPPDYLATIDAGVAGLRLGWTDDFGFAQKCAQDESPRVIETVCRAAHGFSSLGAEPEPMTETWEDFFLGYMVSTYLFMPAGMAFPKPTAEQWSGMLETRQRNWLLFRKVLREVDVLLSPTSQIVAKKVEDWNGAWTRDGARYAHGTFAPTYTSHTHMFNWLGFPAASVPCGFVDGLPVGLQIVGLPGREGTILRVANAFQKAYPRDERPPVS
jgi:amidase/aspartyl-tRNA(Asn)/glutamyl-tRNA(Gln) amidotransferase subunit A